MITAREAKALTDINRTKLIEQLVSYACDKIKAAAEAGASWVYIPAFPQPSHPLDAIDGYAVEIDEAFVNHFKTLGFDISLPVDSLECHDGKSRPFYLIQW